MDINSKPGDLIGFNLMATAPNGFIDASHALRVSETFTMGDVLDCVLRFRESYEPRGFAVTTERVYLSYENWQKDVETYLARRAGR